MQYTLQGRQRRGESGPTSRGRHAQASSASRGPRNGRRAFRISASGETEGRKRNRASVIPKRKTAETDRTTRSPKRETDFPKRKPSKRQNGKVVKRQNENCET